MSATLPRRLLLLAAALLAMLPARVALPQPVDIEEGAIRQLRKATVYRNDGLHHAMLLALRDLRDPALRPLFQSLVQADHWSIQLDAVLGLAELDPAGRADPWLLARLRDERDRADGVRVALDLGMLGREEIEKILAWDDLGAVARVVLLAEARRLGMTPDSAMLRRLADNPDPAIAGLAALVLAQMGDGAPLESFASTLRALPEGERDGVILQLADAAETYELPAAIDLLSFRIDGRHDRPGPQESIVAMALALEPARGAELWRKALGDAPSQSTRVRFGLLLLMSARKVPPANFQALPDPASGDPLLGAMARAGTALASGKEAGPALLELYEMGNRRCCRWVLSEARHLEPRAATTLYLNVLDKLADPTARSADQLADAVDAAMRLTELAPEELRSRLAGRERDSARQEAILVALVGSRAKAAGAAAASVERLGVGRLDALALLAVARHSDSLRPEDLRQLGLIAAGGGSLEETLQVQAAWLYLRHAGRLDQALPRIVGAS